MDLLFQNIKNTCNILFKTECVLQQTYKKPWLGTWPPFWFDQHFGTGISMIGRILTKLLRWTTTVIGATVPLDWSKDSRTRVDEKNWPVVIMWFNINTATKWQPETPHSDYKEDIRPSPAIFPLFSTFSPHYSFQKTFTTSFGSLTRLHVFFRRGGWNVVPGTLITGARGSEAVHGSVQSEWVEEQETVRWSFLRGRLCCSTAVKWGFNPNPAPVHPKPRPRWDK